MHEGVDMPVSHHISARLAAERERELRTSRAAFPARSGGSAGRARPAMVLVRRASGRRFVLRRLRRSAGAA